MLKYSRINTVIFGGYAASDAAIRNVPNGSSFLSLSIAVPTNFKSGQDEEVMFIKLEGGSQRDVDHFGKYPILKGDMVYVQGYLKKVDQYTRPDGTVATNVVVGIDSISCQSKDRSGGTSATPRQSNNAGF